MLSIQSRLRRRTIKTRNFPTASTSGDKALVIDEQKTRGDAYQILMDIFRLVNEQLQFAEAKNGALVTLTLGGALGVGAILANHLTPTTRLSLPIENCLLAIVICFVVSAMIGLVTFLPTLKPISRPAAPSEIPSNVFFFGHIRSWTEAEFLQRVFSQMSIDMVPLDGHTALANQIVSNSQNAHRKFELFAIGAAITLSSTVLVSLVIIATFLLCKIGIVTSSAAV